MENDHSSSGVCGVGPADRTGSRRRGTGPVGAARPHARSRVCRGTRGRCTPSFLRPCVLRAVVIVCRFGLWEHPPRGGRLDPSGRAGRRMLRRMLRRIALVVSALVLVPIADSVAQAQGRLCFAREATISGTDGRDVLRGTPGNDVILGLGGDDVVRGGKGNDRICSGGGADSMRGGPGADRIDGNADADTIAAGGGKDFANGGSGNDSVGGGSGRDRLVGQGGSDELDGGGGRDWVGYSHAAASWRTSRRTAPRGGPRRARAPGRSRGVALRRRPGRGRWSEPDRRGQRIRHAPGP